MSDAPAAHSIVLRVVVDTNVWVSAFINPNGFPAQVRFAWYAGKFVLVTSLPMLEELADVLSRPRLVKKFGLQADEVTELLTALSATSMVVQLTGTVHECRDPDDDIVLETAILGKARYLVSRDDDLKGDADLIAHLAEHGVEVVTVQHFLAGLSENK